MKNTLLFLIVMFLVACNNEQNMKNDTLDHYIIGEWALCGVNLMSYNVCPIIVFNEDGSGNVNSSLKQEMFSWSLINDSLIVLEAFKNSDASHVELLETGKYEMICEIEENNFQLELKSINQDLIYKMGKKTVIRHSQNPTEK